MTAWISGRAWRDVTRPSWAWMIDSRRHFSAPSERIRRWRFADIRTTRATQERGGSWTHPVSTPLPAHWQAQQRHAARSSPVSWRLPLRHWRFSTPAPRRSGRSAASARSDAARTAATARAASPNASMKITVQKCWSMAAVLRNRYAGASCRTSPTSVVMPMSAANRSW